jgi:hypothetical protein
LIKNGGLKWSGLHPAKTASGHAAAIGQASAPASSKSKNLIEARTSSIQANVFTDIVFTARYAKRRWAICGTYPVLGRTTFGTWRLKIS